MVLSISDSVLFYSVFFAFEFCLAAIVQNYTRRVKSTLLVYIDENGKLKVLTWAIIPFVLMILNCMYVAGMRYYVGSDYKNYLPIFNTISDLSGKHAYGSIEPLSAAMMLIFQPFENGYQWYLAFAACIIALLTFIYFLENSLESSFPFMIYIYFMIMYSASLNAIRQILAVAVIVNGFKYIINRRFGKYLLIVIIAAGFHKSALLCLPFYFLYFKPNKYSKMKGNIIIALSMLLPFFIESIFNLIIKVPLFESYGRYTLRDASTYGIHQMLVRLPVIFCVLLYRSRLEKREDSNRFYILLYVIELLSYVLGANITWAFRMAYFCLPSEAILVPQIIRLNKKHANILLGIGFLIYYLFMFWYNVIKNGHDGILPYAFV